MDAAWWIVIAGAATAGFVQGLSGSSFGMVAMSFWVWAVDPRLAAVMAVCGGLTGQLVAAATVRRTVDVARLWPFILGGLAGVPLGVAVLPHLDMHSFKLVLGVLLVVWCPVMLVSRRLPRVLWGGRLADAVAGLGGGVMGGLGGMTGVVPSLWCTVRGLEKDVQRGILQNFNLSMLTVTFATYLAQGLITPEATQWLMVAIPAMLIPTLLGTRLYHAISEARFRQIVLGLLTLSGLAMLAGSLPRWWA